MSVALRRVADVEPVVKAVMNAGQIFLRNSDMLIFVVRLAFSAFMTTMTVYTM